MQQPFTSDPTPGPALAPAIVTLVVNAVAMQAVWFSSVLGAANGWPWLGVLAAALMIGAYLWRTTHRLRLLGLVLVAGLIGLVGETLLMRMEFVRYAENVPFLTWPPAWLLALWLAFATTLDLSLGFLKGRLGIAAILGAIFGPLAYFGGARLGAMTFGDPLWLSLVVMALFWALAMPVLSEIARRADGHRA